MNMLTPRIAVITPCYNEEQVLGETRRRLSELLDRLAAAGKISPESRMYFVDDGSRDATWLLIDRLAAEDPRIVGIKLSRNVGHQNALLAGLLTAEGDALVSIDADLRDDVEVIEEMVDAFRTGTQVVYGVRRRRETDTAFKRMTAHGFYRLMQGMGVSVLNDHADFRLMGRAAVEALRQFREVNLFLRGMVPLLGFPASVVYYDRAERFAGTSKYPLRRMLALALDGITSFSVVPLRLITATGLLVFAISSLLGLWVLGAALFTDSVVPGWASTVLPIYLLGGIQILFLGVLGEYAGKIYKEVKHRPRFIIERTTSQAARPVFVNTDVRFFMPPE